MDSFVAAVIQLSCTSDQARNMQAATHWVKQAAAAGATLVVTPENTNFLGPHQDKVARATHVGGQVTQHFSALARQLGITLCLGSFNERCETDPKRCYNTSVVFGPDGAVIETYRKIHLFDVAHSPSVTFLESNTVVAGTTAKLAKTAVGTLGLSICYDLRFPALYQFLRAQGAQVLTVPSAFTLTTGKDHWAPLLRARAIENQCYVLAAGQTGSHDDGGLRESWGHSMIIDPWGDVIGMASSGEGFALAPLDLRRVQQLRDKMPVIQHAQFVSTKR